MIKGYKNTAKYLLLGRVEAAEVVDQMSSSGPTILTVWA